VMTCRPMFLHHEYRHTNDAVEYNEDAAGKKESAEEIVLCALLFPSLRPPESTWIPSTGSCSLSA
jgi:hypothetical protein